MILVTGGTGFIGQALIRQLAGMGYQVRTLLRPSKQSPHLPVGVPVEAVVCSLKDERGLRAAMRGVETVFHLAGSEHDGVRADLQGVDIEGSRSIAQIASEAGVGRLVYLSHLGADRASAYPILKTKGIAERFILQSEVPYTIIRTGVVFGPGDHFTIGLARLIKRSPMIFLMPGDGSTHLQPIRVSDLVTSMVLAMENSTMANQLLQIGGPEYLTFRQVTEAVAAAIHIRPRIIQFAPAYLRMLGVWVEHNTPDFPMPVFWQDYLAADRTCELDTLPRLFGLMPERLGRNLEYLNNLFIDSGRADSA
jgi:NADH dehydrogenase